MLSLSLYITVAVTYAAALFPPAVRLRSGGSTISHRRLMHLTVTPPDRGRRAGQNCAAT